MNEMIKKTISLESAKCRFNWNIQSYKDGQFYPDSDVNNGNWGRMPVNIIITQTEPLFALKDNLPLVKDIKGNTVLRFRTMLIAYKFLTDFISQSIFYRNCFKNGSYSLKQIAIEDFFGDWDHRFLYTEIPDANTVPVGAMACVNSNAEEFKSLFNNGKSYFDKVFYDFVDDLISNGVDEDKCSEPFIDLPIYIENDIDDMGMTINDSKLWIKGGKYYLGEWVYYSKDSTIEGLAPYMLIKGDDYELCEITGDYYESMFESYKNNDGTFHFIHSEDDIEFNDSKQVLVTNTDTDAVIFKSVNIFYYGYYDDKSKLLKFDDENNTHWGEILQSEDNEYVVTGKCESQLNEFARKQRSYDDHGNKLPFYIEKGEDGSLTPTYNYITGITSNSDDTVNYLEITENSDEMFITFRYVLNASLDADLNMITDTGIEYTEKYPYTNDILICDYDGIKDVEFSYKNIDFSIDNVYYNDDITALKRTPLLAEYSFKSKMINDNIPLHQFRDDTNIGIQNRTEDVDADIERGTYSAIERHSILGEIKTFEDLETYRNGFFFETV